MSDLKDKFSKMTDDSLDYASTYVELLKIKLLKLSINSFASVINILIISLFGSFFILFTGIGLAKWINITYESDILGYFIVGIAFFFMTLLVIAFSKRIVFKYFRKYFIDKIYEQD